MTDVQTVTAAPTAVGAYQYYGSRFRFKSAVGSLKDKVGSFSE